jgi:predicted molibdopterin-dependent oxidoreductase YjgC
MVMLGDHVHYEDGTLGDVGAALDKLEFLVVADAFRSAAVEKADVVFPTTVWAEKTGTFTNMERRVQLLRPVVVNKHADVHADLDVLLGIASAMGAPGLAFDSPASVFEEIVKAVPVYAGISHERLAAETVAVPKPSNDEPMPTQVLYSNDVQQGIQWPSPSKDDKPSSFLYEKSFRYGKARLAAIAWSERPATPTVAQPFLLAHGRVLIQSGRDADVTADGNRNRVGRTEELLLNTADAQKLGIEDGQAVKATSADGWSLTGTARVTDDVLPGVASLTTLFGEMATDIEGTEGPDAMNHVPRLRTVGVRIETA